MTYAVAYLATAIGFLVIDVIWLGFIAKGFYQREIGHLLLENFNMVAAFGFYLMFIAGVVIFAVAPALHADSWKTALLFGALFGLFTYGTYDLTNWATLKGWSPMVTLVDMTWGAFLTSVSAVIGYFATRSLLGS
ncbi:MAG: DUF2177 family protein [Methyloceanibacter sp.]|nr:DUF2177 family protein [Methyloceanibacter sp.]